MCGIIGYAGHRPAVPVVVEGLRRLEYRGYDSAGVAFARQGDLHVVRATGKLAALEEKLAHEEGVTTPTSAMGHTRWATHGVPAERNAHPHRSNDGTLAIVHNGIIENYGILKERLIAKGDTFENALQTRTFEPDAPNFTPRISGIIDGDRYTLSILKSANGNPDSTCRYFFDYQSPLAGEGHFIHSYRCDGNPIPSFEGEPKKIAVNGDIDAFTESVWNSLNADNKVSLFTRYIDLTTGETQTRICNKNQ